MRKNSKMGNLIKKIARLIKSTIQTPLRSEMDALERPGLFPIEKTQTPTPVFSTRRSNLIPNSCGACATGNCADCNKSFGLAALSSKPLLENKPEPTCQRGIAACSGPSAPCPITKIVSNLKP
jgi:hypothetical protein